MHFYKNKAFLVNYIYNQLNNRQKDYVSDSIMSKYLSRYNHAVDLMTTKISDRHNSVLFMDNSLMGLKITNMSSCECDWYEAMADFVNDRRAKQEEKMGIGEKRFFDRI
jgi:hypothetical protein